MFDLTCQALQLQALRLPHYLRPSGAPLLQPEAVQPRPEVERGPALSGSTFRLKLTGSRPVLPDASPDRPRLPLRPYPGWNIPGSGWAC